MEGRGGRELRQVDRNGGGGGRELRQVDRNGEGGGGAEN